MATPLKDLYSPAFVDEFCMIAGERLDGFDPIAFKQTVFDADWPQRELKDRMGHLADSLIKFLPADFPLLAQKLMGIVDALEQKGITDKGLEYMFLPEIVAKSGMEHPENAIKAMERITCYTSCEFAVRPFYLKYPELMTGQALKWARHGDHRVRRFASEGCRPRLPWAMGIHFLKKDPSSILPVLELLKNDPAEWVRRSVANNLNDISKDHPELAFQLAASWKGISPETDWVVKHGCRTLLKKGIPRVLQLFGFADPSEIKVEQFKCTPTTFRIGEDLMISFRVCNTTDKAVRLRLEYAIHFLRANGTLSPKVFHIRESEFPPHSEVLVEKKHSFRIITTRSYYPGGQAIAVIVNGVEFDRNTFDLLEA